MDRDHALEGSNALRVAAVLLAAGEGSRMGGLPKCLMRLEGKTLIERHCEAMVASGITRLVVVTGFYHQQIEAEIARLGVTIARNPHPEAGQPSSVRTGLEALGGSFDLVIVALADQPLVGSVELDELIRAFRQRPTGTQIVYPSVAGQRGNPVLFAGDLIARLMDNGGPMPGRKYIDDHPELVHMHDTANPSFVLDLDTRDDVEAFERRTGARILMPQPGSS